MGAKKIWAKDLISSNLEGRRLEDCPFVGKLGWVEIKQSSLAKILTGIAITVTGLLCVLIPGAGWFICGTLTSAGLTGLARAVQDPKITWGSFFTEVGIGAAIGAATAVATELGNIANILSQSIAEEAIKGAILGAVNGSISELIRMGLDPSQKDFNWTNVIVASAVGAAIGALKHYLIHMSNNS